MTSIVWASVQGEGQALADLHGDRLVGELPSSDPVNATPAELHHHSAAFSCSSDVAWWG